MEEKFRDIVSLIERNKGLVKIPAFGNSLSDTTIQQIEIELGIVLPPSFKWWLRNYGPGRIGEEAIYGAFQNDSEMDLFHDIVYVNTIKHTSNDLPPHFIEFCSGSLNCSFWFDTRFTNENNELKIYRSNDGEVYADSFLNFIKKRIRANSLYRKSPEYLSLENTYRRVKRYIDENPDLVDTYDRRNAVTRDIITETERQLHAKLPPSYIWWLENYSGASIGDLEIYGILIESWEDSITNELVYHNTGELKMKSYNSSQFVICSSSLDGDFYFDTRTFDTTGEMPVFSERYSKKVADNFIQFIDRYFILCLEGADSFNKMIGWI
ncbi:MAG: SMI1/KNR4 family protein [Candidatus Zixiibacteriota bacterium]